MIFERQIMSILHKHIICWQSLEAYNEGLLMSTYHVFMEKTSKMKKETISNAYKIPPAG